jgi:GNAT superfamily N-acetyltransferase/ABC-type ATPase involved in cell division
VHVTAQVETPFTPTARSLQVAGMFDVPVADKLTRRFDMDVPIETRVWNVGLITGPSGSGKTTIARHLWPRQLAAAPSWPTDASILDAFPLDLTISQVTGHLTAVGLSSPPAWLRPYRVLSNGEAFRADTARILADTAPGATAVVDEFTSVVDRQVARAASHAVARHARATGIKFVAVTCHSDLTDWLQPDWVLDAGRGEFTWRSVQPRPRITLAIHRVSPRRTWPRFRDHHYLSGEIHPSATCFTASVDGQPVAFTSFLNFPHPRTRLIRMGHRHVVLPDWQGLGIGGALVDWLGAHVAGQGLRFRAVETHPALIAHMRSSPLWAADETHRRRVIDTRSTDRTMRARARDPRSLTTRSFEYVGHRARTATE